MGTAPRVESSPLASRPGFFGPGGPRRGSSWPTDPERFRGLHQAARELLDDLAARYEVDRANLPR